MKIYGPKLTPNQRTKRNYQQCPVPKFRDEFEEKVKTETHQQCNNWHGEREMCNCGYVGKYL